MNILLSFVPCARGFAAITVLAVIQVWAHLFLVTYQLLSVTVTFIFSPVITHSH